MPQRHAPDISQLIREIILHAEHQDYDRVINKIKNIIAKTSRIDKNLARKLRIGFVGTRLFALADFMKQSGLANTEIVLREVGANALVVLVVCDEKRRPQDIEKARAEAYAAYQQILELAKEVDEKIVFKYPHQPFLVFRYDWRKLEYIRNRMNDIRRGGEIKLSERERGKVAEIHTPQPGEKSDAQEAQQRVLEQVNGFDAGQLLQLWDLYFDRSSTTTLGIQVKIKRDGLVTASIKRTFAEGITRIATGVVGGKLIINPADVTRGLIKKVKDKLFAKR